MTRLRKYIQYIRIEFERWRFRRKYKSGDKVDLENQLKAVEKARALSSKRKCRLWVVRLWPGKYRIYSKGDVKAVLKNLGLKHQVDMYQLNEVVVHITK